MGNAILETLSAAWTFLWTWVRGLPWDAFRWDAFRWDVLGLGVLLVLLAAVLLLRRRRAPAPKPIFPDLDVSLGSIVIHAPVRRTSVYRADNRLDHRADFRSEGGATSTETATETATEAATEAATETLTLPTELNVTVSNASPYSVQLLEVALETAAMARPVSFSVTRLLLADSAVRLKERLPALRGDEGRLTLSFYAAATPDKYFRLQAAFYLETPDRYTISPLEQIIKPAKLLGENLEQTSKRLRRGAEPRRKSATESTAEREERKKLEFPDEF